MKTKFSLIAGIMVGFFAGLLIGWMVCNPSAVADDCGGSSAGVYPEQGTDVYHGNGSQSYCFSDKDGGNFCDK